MKHYSLLLSVLSIISLASCNVDKPSTSDYSELSGESISNQISSDDYSSNNQTSTSENSIVDENGTLWCKSRKDISYSAEELVQGVRLQVGAARTKVFEILPCSAKMENVKAIRTLGATLQDYESVKGDLLLAVDAEVGRRKDGVKTDTSIALPH